ncbi:MAG: OmpA family protein [Bacteroidota bacterium]|nr:OmpA family protein [Bacteroidota bacterium]
MFNRSFPILFCILAFAASGFAQDRPSFGIFGDFSLNKHSANFQQLPGVPSCCPRYESGSGTGPAFGGLYFEPLSELFDLELRALYHSLSGTLSETEATTVLHNGVPTQGAFQHTLSTGLSTISIEPMLDLKLIGDLRMNFGFDVGILLAKSYSEQEEITQPDGAGTFLDSVGGDTHSRIRNQQSGTIPNASTLQVAALGGLSYALPLNAGHTTYLVPEVLYSFGITKIASDLAWNVNSLRIGASIVFSPQEVRHEERKEIDTVRIERDNINASIIILGKESQSVEPEERDGIMFITHYTRRTDTLAIPKKHVMDVSVTAVGVDANGNETPVVRMTVEEFSSTMMTPLLNYIFFDENSSEIPKRYHRIDASETDTFTIAHAHSQNKLATYHDLLNIIGKRLHDNEKANVTVTGCNEDIRSEKANLSLSRNRAEAVKKYFTEVWHIAPRRIKTEARNLSPKAAHSDTPDGDEENRRVEITSSDPKILFPVITDDTLRKANPPVLRFKPIVQNDESMISWELAASQDKKILKDFKAEGKAPASIDWKFEPQSMPKFSGNIYYAFSADDLVATFTSTPHSIPIEQITIRKKREERRGDTVINRFSLILFDVGSAAVTPHDAPVVSMIKEYVKPDSRVTVVGYTDRLGEASYNQQLSEHRAVTIASSLGSKNVTAKGLGQADLYDSSLPEGRLYTRTVNIEIKTPVSQ